MSIEALPRVLCVDDEPLLLAALERTLSERYDVATASSAAKALRLIENEAPFDVIMSDMRMPEMDGAQFLSRVRARWPDASRILLTGQTDLPAAAAAVNDGGIFRFLSKPCPGQQLFGAIDAGIEHSRLKRAERDLLERTLSGAVEMLTDLLDLVVPEAPRRTAFLRRCVRHALASLQWPDAWIYDMAARLSQVGAITMGDDVSSREAMTRAAEVSFRLLAKIPRIETVAEIVRYQCEPPPANASEVVTRGAALLRAGLELDAAHLSGNRANPSDILVRVQPALPRELPGVFADFAFESGASGATRAARAAELRIGDVLDEDLRTTGGVLLLSRGHQINGVTVERISRLAKSGGLREPIRVRTGG